MAFISMLNFDQFLGLLYWSRNHNMNNLELTLSEDPCTVILKSL